MPTRRTALCACGQASITVEGDPQMQGVCHCTDCKRRTGSAFGISSYFLKTRVISTSGETSVYAFHHAARAQDQARHFCPRCGSTLYWHISALPDLIGVAGGCFADEGLPEPAHSVTHRKKESWLALPPTWKVHEE